MLLVNNPVANIGLPDSDGRSADGAAIVEQIRLCVERVRVEFERWNDPYAHGPGLYFVVERDSAAAFAEPMGTNRWPVEDCVDVFGASDSLYEAARTVALTCDGAVVVNNDGTIREKIVRMEQLPTAEREQKGDLPYAEWMGTRHMSALETSTRDEILAVVTLSEEDGRMTVFTDGRFEDYPRDTLGNE